MLAPGAVSREDDPVRSVLFVVHPDRPAATDLSAVARAWWETRGYEVDFASGEPPESSRQWDFAVSFGGDGTILRTVQVALPHGTPVLGINLGRMGFLAQVEPAGMQTAFEHLINGTYQVEERMALAVTVRKGDAAAGAGSTHVALNEAIVERIAPGHTIRVGVDIGGRRFLTYVADGLLVCTPTGSTAYNLSARGPVVSPTMRALVLTPVAPHLVFDRSLVVGPDEPVVLTLLDDRPATAVLDGMCFIPLVPGDALVCSASELPARFVRFGDLDFQSVLRARLSLADR
jgi:NAD+ kinase